MTRFRSDGKVLAAGGRYGTVKLWDLSGNPGTWKNIGNDQTNLVTVVAGFRPSNVKGEQSTNDDEWCQGSVTSLEFVPNSTQMLAVGCQDGTIHLYDIEALKFGKQTDYIYPQLEVLQGPDKAVDILSYDTKKRLLYSTGATPYIDKWRVPTKSEFERRLDLQRDLRGLAQDAAKFTDMNKLNNRILETISKIRRSAQTPAKEGGAAQ